jgi:nitroimidazol reductase NimA-like FMN-containing flavoprotein (pyridoxamine 5'-phosphate oxidase superfamily)
MPERKPVSAQPFGTTAALPTPWEEARTRLEEAQFYWLATVRPDGGPHVMPVLAVWVEGSLHVSAGPSSRKARNLAQDPRCVMTVDGDDLHLVVEGAVERVRDEARLRRVADEYAIKYGWQVTIEDGAFSADGAPTAGPPPYEVYELIPTRVFGLGTDESFGATRWTF